MSARIGQGLGRVASEFGARASSHLSFLTRKDRLVVPFKFVPLARPGLPSAARQLAYERGTALVGPEADPAGWKTLEPVTLEGTLNKTTVAKIILKVCTHISSCGTLVDEMIVVRSQTSTSTPKCLGIRNLALITLSTAHVHARHAHSPPPRHTESRRRSPETLYPRGFASGAHPASALRG